MQTLVRALFSIYAASSLGCIIPYAYPTLGYTPCLQSVNFKAENHEIASANDVRAFRLDVSRHWVDIGSDDEISLTELSLGEGGAVPFQFKPSLTYGFYVFGVALNFPVDWSSELCVRLYRPGYQSITIRPWETVQSIQWRIAPDLDAQEVVLDELFSWKDESPPWRGRTSSHKLVPGSTSKAHRDALLFGVAEYARLANLSTSTKQRVMLMAKSEEFRELSNK